MQTSMVFSQREWPAVDPRPHKGGPDLDDCWVLSAIQAVNVTSPWYRLVGCKAFRHAAGDPDDGVNDGGNVTEIIAGIEGCYPELKGRAHGHRGVAWIDLKNDLDHHRPVSVAVLSSELPPGLRYGFEGLHQVTLAQKANGQLLIANPLAQPYARWDRIEPNDVRDAVMTYGERRSGSRSAWYVTLPTDVEALAIWRGHDEPNPED